LRPLPPRLRPRQLYHPIRLYQRQSQPDAESSSPPPAERTSSARTKRPEVSRPELQRGERFEAGTDELTSAIGLSRS
jgi:hypothetical protein